MIPICLGLPIDQALYPRVLGTYLKLKPAVDALFPKTKKKNDTKHREQLFLSIHMLFDIILLPSDKNSVDIHLFLNLGDIYNN